MERIKKLIVVILCVGMISSLNISFIYASQSNGYHPLNIKIESPDVPKTVTPSIILYSPDLSLMLPVQVLMNCNMNPMIWHSSFALQFLAHLEIQSYIQWMISIRL